MATHQELCCHQTWYSTRVKGLNKSPAKPQSNYWHADECFFTFASNMGKKVLIITHCCLSAVNAVFNFTLCNRSATYLSPRTLPTGRTHVIRMRTLRTYMYYKLQN